jgi:hypothetical protein
MQSEKSKLLFEQIAKGKEEIKKIKSELKEKLRDNFHGLTKELFNSYPELKSIGWRQYTPYFNDGEACEFRSAHDYPTINGNDENYGKSEQPEGVLDIVKLGSEEIYDENWKIIANPDYNSYYSEIVKTVKEFLNQFDDEDMKDLFGDHVTVHITSNGVDVQDYEDHD